MSDGYNLVDNMIQDMQSNNTPETLSYQPQMGGGQPQMGGGQPQMMGGAHTQYGMPGQVQMGEVQYIPPEQQQAMTVPNQMQQNMSGESMIPPDLDQSIQGGVDEAVMDGPDLSTYGMDEGHDGMMDQLMDEAKGPLIVVALAFAMSLPQVNGILRGLLSRVTTNPLYMNIAMAIILGLVFYFIKKFL